MVTPVDVDCTDWIQQPNSPYYDGTRPANSRPTGTVYITGTLTEGQTLTCSNTLADLETLGTFSYQWNRDGSPIGAATSVTYVLVTADAGTSISVTISYTDGSAQAESKTSSGTIDIAALDLGGGGGAYTPLHTSSFDEGTAGTTADGADGYDSAYSSVYSTDQASSGTQSAKLIASSGYDNTFKFGGQYNFASKLKKGDEVWARTRIYMPTAFNFDVGDEEGEWLKFMRLRTEPVGGGNRGYNDIYLDETAGGGRFIHIHEATAATATYDAVSAEPTRDAWDSYEMYTYFDNTAADSGGNGVTRFWQNGLLVLEITDQATLSVSTDVCPYLLLFSYWNGGTPTVLSGVTGTFQVGETVTGQTSGKTRTIAAITDSNTLYFTAWASDPAFTTGETILGNTSGASGTLDNRYQICYMDDVIITTNRSSNGGSDNTPSNIDASGNVYIGDVPTVADFTYVPPVGYLFWDDFASGDLSKTENGMSWGGSSYEAGNDLVSVGTTNPKDGVYALEFDYGGNTWWKDDAQAEQNFNVGSNESELWMRADVYIPSNYIHREIVELTITVNSGSFVVGDTVTKDGDTDTGTVHSGNLTTTLRLYELSPTSTGAFSSPSYTITNQTRTGTATVTARAGESWNNKVFYFFEPTDSTGFKLGCECWPDETKTGSSILTYNVVRSDGSTGVGHKTTTAYWVDRDNDLGKWHEWIFRIKVPTNTGTSDGAMQAWKNNVKVIDKTNLSNATTSNNYIDRGYFEGWKNSGFTGDTKVIWDNVTFATSNLFGVS